VAIEGFRGGDARLWGRWRLAARRSRAFVADEVYQARYGGVSCNWLCLINDFLQSRAPKNLQFGFNRRAAGMYPYET
jgi:hypothetical protein